MINGVFPIILLSIPRMRFHSPLSLFGFWLTIRWPGLSWKANRRISKCGFAPLRAF